jgi:hypothetical protein
LDCDEVFFFCGDRGLFNCDVVFLGYEVVFLYGGGAKCGGGGGNGRPKCCGGGGGDDNGAECGGGGGGGGDIGRYNTCR